MRLAIALFCVAASATLANAHVSLLSGPAQANKSQKITFGVGHGCNGDDTYTVRVQIPAGVVSVRTETSDPLFTLRSRRRGDDGHRGVQLE